MNLTTTSLALALGSALGVTSLSAAAEMDSKDKEMSMNKEMVKCYGRSPEGQERLCGRTGHHLRRDLHAGLPGQRLETGT